MSSVPPSTKRTKCTFVGESDGKKIWETEDLPIYGPTNKISKIEKDSYILASPEWVKNYRKQLRLQHAPDVPDNLRNG